MKKAIRPVIFKWRQTEPELILCAVRGYLRYSLSFRDVEELLSERGLKADHTTIWRWVQRYGPELEERLRRHLKPTHRSWRVDETYVRVKGRWCCLYRAIDSTGATIDFVLSRLRDAATAKRLFRKALTNPSHRQPRVINTDPAHLYGTAISGVKWVTPLLVLRIHHSATTRVVAIANIPAGMNSSRSPISVASTPMA